MKKRIRIIFLLIIASLIGLIIIQGFWITKFYRINKEQVAKEIKLSLENGVKKEMTLRYAQHTSVLFPNIDTKSVVFVADSLSNPELDSIVQLVRKGKKLNPANITYHVSSVQGSIPELDSVPETVELRLREMLGSLLSDQQVSIQLHLIDSMLRADMDRSGFDMEYQLKIHDRMLSSSQIDDNALLNGEEDSKAFLTHKVPATILGDKEIHLRIDGSVLQLFSSPIVKGSFLATLALLILVVSSYFYMLKTIFDQKKLSSTKSDFINNMTHELKTPIATVSAIVESMQNFGVLDDRQKTEKYLDVSKKELGRLSGLVEKVLNMAREEREPLKMNPEQLNIREVFDNIINSQTIKQVEKQLSFDLKIDEDAEKVTADCFHLVNVMHNLIENSIKYSNDPLMIRIASERNGEYIKISLSDNGIGIPKRHQSKVFDQFYRVPTGDVHDVKGFGLGLYYVRNIVEKHGGKIGLHSEIGAGSTFIINLPL
ncbi:sensor histidine kinase [Marinifilum caeruleilacunae]|nr:HAMP domain-containing sensor histidine kinase [Marinifilum caeruleilacunae]